MSVMEAAILSGVDFRIMPFVFTKKIVDIHLVVVLNQELNHVVERHDSLSTP